MLVITSIYRPPHLKVLAKVNSDCEHRGMRSAFELVVEVTPVLETFTAAIVVGMGWFEINIHNPSYFIHLLVFIITHLGGKFNCFVPFIMRTSF